MASSRNREGERERTPETAELHRDVLSAVAHELGGIASALDLRAEALSRTIPEKDLAALRDLAGELRVTTRAVRFVRGADASGMLSPTRLQTMAEWWSLARRFTSVVLPRGVAIDAQLGDASLEAAHASALTWMWLAACKEISDRIAPPCTLTIRAAQGAGARPGVTLTAELNPGHLSSTPDDRSRWAGYAGEFAAELGVERPSWQQEGTLLRWCCVIPG
jgi:hypothetical protein